MSKLNELIQALCPDGVEYKTLKDVLTIKNGRDYKSFNQGSVPVYGSGGIMTYVDTYAYDGPSVLIPRKGSLSNIFYVEGQFWTVDTIFYTIIDENQVLPKYVFYYLKNAHLEKLNQAGGVPSLNQGVLYPYPIPVPPLPVQEEIARILDSFTELEAELEAELADRKKQYEYFRGRLLDDKNLERMDGKPVETKKLGDVSRVFGGYAFKSKEYTVSGARVMRISDVQAGYISNENAKYCPIDQPKQADSARLLANDLLVSLTGNVGRVAMVDDTVLPAYLNQRVAGIRTTDAINHRFLFHYLNQHQFIADCERAGKGSAQKNLSMGYLTNYEIPVPSLDTQKRIVDILDRFDTLTTSLTNGIPAEIAMRREQYEYCRSRILDFPRLPDDAVSDGE